MSNNQEMKEGNWVRFAPLSAYRPVIKPGRSIEFKLESSSPPGLVECRVHGGGLGLKGVGEDMPQELENVLPGYRDWPSGYTVGPVESLKTLSQADRARYVLKQLPQFRRLGWMTQSSSRWYEQNLSRVDFEAVYKHATQDLKTGHITSEVIAIIEGMRNQQ